MVLLLFKFRKNTYRRRPKKSTDYQINYFIKLLVCVIVSHACLFYVLEFYEAKKDPCHVPLKSCPSNFTMHHDTCYLYVHTAMAHPQAAQYCRSMDAVIAEPRNYRKNQDIKAIIHAQEKPVSTVWLGATDTYTESVFVWTSQGDTVSYTDWLPGHTWGRGQHCLVYQRVGTFLEGTFLEGTSMEGTSVEGWNSSDCSVYNQYICETPTQVTGLILPVPAYKILDSFELAYLSDEEIDSWTDLDVKMVMHLVMRKPTTVCHRLWKVTYPWHFCNDEAVRPARYNCTVYDFSDNSSSSFVDYFRPECLFGTGLQTFEQNVYESGKLWKRRTIPLGVSDHAYTDDKGVRYDTVAHVMDSLGDATIDILKIDVRFVEWTALPEMITSGVLNNTKQLLVKYTLRFNRPKSPDGRANDTLTDRQRLRMFRDLHMLGFRVYLSFPKTWCEEVSETDERYACYWVHYLQVNKR